LTASIRGEVSICPVGIQATLMCEAIALNISEEKIMRSFKEQNTREFFSESYKHTKLNQIDGKFYNLIEKSRSTRIKMIREKPEAFTGN
jgi:hypothetical protein